MSVPPLALLDGEASLERFTDHSSALRWMASEAGLMTARARRAGRIARRLSIDLTSVAIEARGYAV